MPASVQSTGLQSTGSVASLAKAFAGNVTVGNTIRVGIIGNKTTGAPTFTATPPSDTLGNTYVQRGTYAGGNVNTRLEIWSAVVTTGGACTVTVTPNASALVSLVIEEVSGIDTTTPVGNTGTGTGTSTAPATGTITVSTANEDIFAIVTHEGATTTITKAAAFTELFVDTDATEMPVEGEYVVTSSNVAATWTLGASAQWECLAVSFKATAAPPVTVTLGSFDPDLVASSWFDPGITALGAYDYGPYVNELINAAAAAAAVSDVPLATMIPMAIMAM